MPTTIGDPSMRRHKVPWLKTIGVTLAALFLGGATVQTAPPTATAPPASPAPVIKAALVDPPQVPPPLARRGSATVVIELEKREQRMRLADGVEYEFWTFNGHVPGPFLRVRVGDTVELHLKNAPANRYPHSIDLHAVTGPGGGATLTQTAPGQTTSVRWRALNPGLYVYHCGTPPVPQHVANGLYGLILVEPAEGLAPVDREFYVMQGEVYTAGALGDGGLQPFSLDKLLAERPEYIVFNGAVGALTGARALRARVGETVRIFFGVGGPNVTSSLHMIGEIFDTVHPEGAAEALHHVQTTLVPAGGATIVEVTFQVPGTYLLVDHSLSRLVRGAVGELVVEGADAAEIYGKVPGM
ncbi:MAG TPA: copper-containing nitrite reductase [Alphaproteobacteria bacterium]|nr:copper-containing nitrite reductase [Alphaproteobacteria bacterium]